MAPVQAEAGVDIYISERIYHLHLVCVWYVAGRGILHSFSYCVIIQATGGGVV